ncbi:hypothetical protein XENOCAPTIV_009149 [Xenoophorus captivus]|uniref:Uncharacterized protein n=1 Tax=Xenoophorus captivus TaxID=1517983 RepID=A0ABV0RXX2_9TELE
MTRPGPALRALPPPSLVEQKSEHRSAGFVGDQCSAGRWRREENRVAPVGRDRKKQEKQSLVSVVADLRLASVSTTRFITETLLLLEVIPHHSVDPVLL